MSKTIRLDKFLANNTIYSRSQIHKLIKSKQVSINNILQTDVAFKIDSLSHEVKVQEVIIKPSSFFYLAMNKGPNTVCSHTNRDGISILNFLDPLYLKQGVHIVGRLDKDTTGLILLTNDGTFTHKLKSPKYNVDKEYLVTLNQPLIASMLQRLKQPIQMDGKMLKPFVIKPINDKQCHIIIHEGKYHQIKRIFHLVQNEVVALKRIRIGKLNLDQLNLALNEYQEINLNEII